MASLSHSESRRKYSWWWDSHISPKNSKWLQENLTDMDAKVKAMIKLIEEDADSFARRAEMYYKKRPELMKLVEEFYRAYRALAERYDHATVELRQAHRTMSEVFPNQVPYVLPDDPLSSSSSLDGEAHTPQTRHPIYSFLDEDELQKDASGLASANLHPEESDTRVSRRGLKQFNEMFGSGEIAQERKIRKSLKGHEAAYANAVEEAETEVQTLKKALAEIQDEKEAALLQYQQSLEKLCRLERELEDAGGLSERASRAEIEIKVLKETLAKLEAERDADLLQHSKCLERISVLESMIFQTQKDVKGLDERAIRAETEAQSLKQELSALEAEKEAGLLQYNRSLELISTLENKLSHAEENARMLNELTERAETEIKTLKQAFSKLKEEKEAAERLYEQCLARIATMEREISRAQEDVKRLNSEIVMGATKLRSAEEQCFLLERSNQSLHLEADNLVQKIQVKDQELTEKEDELQKLQALMQDEQSRFLQVEATLQTLQKLHSQSQEEQKALVLELQNKLQMLKDLEICNHDLQGDLQRVKDENQSLNESNSTSSISITNLKDEISSLKVLKEKLERDVSLQVAYTNSLQQEIYNLKEEMERLNRRYQALLEQVHSAGLNPEGLSSSVKDLQDENLRLKEVCRKDRDERGALYEKLSGMNMLLQKNVAFERSLSELGGKLEGSREKAKELQESCQFLQGEKSGLAAEKAILLSQLQIMTENVQKLLEKNSLMENSLSGANVELEGLRTKSKSLEEFCQMLKNEKSCLLNEKSTLVSQLENVEKRLGMLEMRFTRLEEKYSDLEKQKETATNKVNELWSYIGVEKQERSYYIQSSESRLADLESEVHLLQEERKLSKKEFEEELDKAVNAQLEIFILQKFIKDLEEKNSSLFVECQKHVESSKLSDKVISELEAENLEQQVEVEFLLDEIENLRIGVQQVFKALQFDPVNVNEGLIEGEQIPLTQVLDDVEDLKSSLLRNEDERQQLEVENLVLSTLLGQSRSEGVELESQKIILEQEFKALTELHCVQNKNSQELLEMNRQLKLEVSTGEEKEELLKTHLESQSVNLLALQASYQTLQEENVKELVENRYLLQKFSDLKEEMCILEEENSSILREALALGTLSTVFESCASEKREELKALSEDFSSLHLVTNDLKKKVEVLEAKLEMKEMETLHLNARIEKLQQELLEGKDLNDELTYQIIIEKDFLVQKATEIVEVEEKLKATNTGNAELSRTIDDLMRECAESKLAKGNFEKQVLELSRDGTNQRREIEFLREANECLESEVRMLHKEVEERRAKEENLSLELQERNNESELWEAEASSFYFDLQMSCVHEVLLNDKVHELTAVFESLEEENATKDTEIERMRDRFVSLESEIGELKAHLSAFVPVISSLRDTVDSLEHNSVRRTKCFKDAEMAVQPQKLNRQELVDDEGTMLRDGISDLLKMQARIKAVEKAMVEQVDRRAAEKAVVQEMGQPETQEKVKAKGKLESPVKGAKHLEHRSRSIGESDIKEEMELENKLTDKVKSQKNKPEISDIRSILMKDIPLDQVSDRSIYRRSRSKRASSGTDCQMLELWESAEKNSYFDLMANTQRQEVVRSPKVSPSKFKYARQKSRRRSFELQVEKEVGIDRLEVSTSLIREPKQEGSGGKILERLASDAQKLISLETAVQELKKQMEMRKRSKKTNNPEFERVDQQLQEVEAAVMQLIDASNKLKKDIEDIPPSSEGNISPGTSQKRRFAEQARKRSEKIGRLQFDVQSIQYVLLKLEDEKKSMGKHRFPGSRTGIILRDFISSGRRTSMRRKKARFCGCVRPSANEDERTS